MQLLSARRSDTGADGRFGSQDPLVLAVERGCQLCAKMMAAVTAANAMGAERHATMMESMARGCNLDRPGQAPRVRRGAFLVGKKGQVGQAKHDFELEVESVMRRAMERDQEVVLQL